MENKYGSPPNELLLKLAGQVYSDTRQIDSMIAEKSANLQSNLPNIKNTVENIARSNIVGEPTPPQQSFQPIPDPANISVNSQFAPAPALLSDPSQMEFGFVKKLTETQPYIVELLEDILSELKKLNTKHNTIKNV